MLNCKFLFAQVSFPLNKVIWKVRCRLAKYDALRIQNCYFYGSPDFVSISKSALSLLDVLDKPLHDSLLKSDYLFWEEPAGALYLKRLCGIAPEFVAWKQQGIIACVIHAYFENEFVYADSSLIFQRNRLDSSFMKALKSTRDWLNNHEFPCELAECFVMRRR